MAGYSLKDLEAETGLSGRVIRDYIARGFLPGPVSKGRNAQYSETHLMRLRCLQVLRESTPPQFTLEMLGGVLNSLSEDRIRDIATGNEEVQALTLGAESVGTVDSSQLADALTVAGTDSSLAQLVRQLDSVLSGRRAARKGAHERWVSVRVTPDLEIRARNLANADIGNLERLADQLRQLLQGKET